MLQMHIKNYTIEELKHKTLGTHINVHPVN